MQILTGVVLLNSRIAIIAILVVSVLLLHFANASYTVQNLNVTLQLQQNTSVQVIEQLHIIISNSSVVQYSTNRVALNLSLSDWQSLIGPLLVQHIISQTSGVYNFKFLPGPVINNLNNQHTANILLTYDVQNVTSVQEISPRVFQYTFNQKVLNFEHGVSGQVLTPNTTLTIVLPPGSQIKTAYPIPDLPSYSFENNYKNVTTVSWLYGEPLSRFTLVYTVKQSIQAEVASFFQAAYYSLGVYTYVIIAVVIIAALLYIYRRAIT
jgi:hypothetical protein